MTSRTAQRRRTDARIAPSARRRRLPWTWIIATVVVLAAAAVAVAVAGGASDDSATDGQEQTRPVEVTGTALAPMPNSGADPSIGSTIPTVSGSSFDGSPVVIAADGRPKVILFAAHWCPHCQREIPMLSEHLSANPLPADVDLVTVATATNPDAPNYPPSEWLAENPLPGVVLADSADGAAAKAFGLTGYPFFVAVDADGQVVARASGEIGAAAFDQLVDAATA
jgi:thiol-disulfide isomerase/thioredoxin